MSVTHQRASMVRCVGDLSVNRIGFGALQLTGPDHWGPPADRTAAITLLRTAVGGGANLIDSADSYGLGDNETLIAEALFPYPADLVVATKVGRSRPSPRTWKPLGRPEYLRQQVELSLRRLRVECIDLLQLHRVDPEVPLADQVGALAELRAEGKIRHVGLSKVSIGQLAEATRVVEIASVQNAYDVGNRADEELLEHCERADIAFLAYRPLANGRLAEAGGPAEAVAAELACTRAQLALAWLLHRSPVLVAIPGTTSPEHLRDNLAASAIELTAAQFDRVGNGFLPPADGQGDTR